VFEVTLVRLRKQLGPHGHQMLRMESGQVSLNRANCWTDTDALDALLKRVEALESAASTPAAAELCALFEGLIDLCRGPFVGPWELPPELLAADASLRSRAARMVRVVCSQLERLGDSAAAESAYVRAIEAELCPELLLAPAVACMLARGRASDARTLVQVSRQRGVESDEAETLLRKANRA